MKKHLLIIFLMTHLLSGINAQTVSTGKILRITDFHSGYVPSRNIDIWIPEGYTTSSGYAVLYMQDGQMLYDSATTWNHQEWDVDGILGKLQEDGRIRNTIVVGIWNIPKNRHAEFFPQKAFEGLTESEQKMILEVIRNDTTRVFANHPCSDNYLKFIVDELKPFIDRTFSTLPDRSNTFIAGSSMGGLISLYALCEYPDVFGGAACLSTHWTGIFRAEDNPLPDALIRYLDKNLPSPSKHRIYFDYGSATLDALYKPFQEKADQVMRKRGYTSKNWMTREFPGEDHSENAWRKRFEIPAVFLLAND